MSCSFTAYPPTLALIPELFSVLTTCSICNYRFKGLLMLKKTAVYLKKKRPLMSLNKSPVWCYTLINYTDSCVL